jgi:hypothetical protein
MVEFSNYIPAVNFGFNFSRDYKKPVYLLYDFDEQAFYIAEISEAEQSIDDVYVIVVFNENTNNSLEDYYMCAKAGTHYIDCIEKLERGVNKNE